MKAKRQAVGSIHGPHKTGSKGFGDDNLGVKPGEDKSVWRRDYLQLEAWELDLKQQPTSQKRKKEIEEAPSDPKEGTQEVRPDPAEEMRQALSARKEEAQEAPSDSEEKTDPDKKTREAPSNPQKGHRRI